MKRIALLATLVGCAIVTMAQTGRLFDGDNYLASSFTNQLYIDRDGLLWIATNNGINRYDGYSFRLFQRDMDGCEGLAANYVIRLMQGDDGTMYLGSFAGMQSYYDDGFHDVEMINERGETVTDYINHINKLRDGTILISTAATGVLRMEGRDKAVPAEGLSGFTSVWKTFESSDGHLYVLTSQQGVVEITGDGGRSLHLQDVALRSSAQSICEDAKGNIYVGTMGHGLMVRGRGESSFVHVDLCGNYNVNELYVRPDSTIIIGFDGQGIAFFDPQEGTIVMNPLNSHEIDIAHTKINSFVEDENGNLWIGLIGSGVYMLPHLNTGFNSMGRKTIKGNQIGDYSVSSTLIDSKGNLWVGTDKDGIYLLGEDMRQKKHFTKGFPTTIFGITEDVDGKIWIGSYDNGAGYIDISSGTYKRVTEGGSQRVFSTFAIKADSVGNVWIATMGDGLARYDTHTGSLSVMRGSDDAYYDSLYNALPNGYIEHIDVSADGKRVFVGTTMGLCCYDVEHDSWTSVFGCNMLYKDQSVNCVHYGGDNVLWFGTVHGLTRYDLTSKTATTYTRKDGLADNSISSIINDNDGNLWVATTHGLSRFNLSSGQVESNYYADDGLHGNEFSGGGANTMGNDGKLVFGGPNGITWFYPSDIKERAWHPSIHITDFLIGSHPVASRDKSGRYTITDRPVANTDVFHLAPADNSISISLSTLTYDSPEHIIYSYSINESQWTELKPGANMLSFNRLSPGTYHFRVIASKNGQQSEEKAFTVIVHYPWYQSWWAWAIYILLFILAVCWYLRSRQAKEKARLRLQEHIHAEEMSEAKIRFFMNISHEIRTPMTLIVAPLMQLMKEDDNPHRQGIYTTIKRNAERILHLINQLMDLRKIDKGQMALRMRETEMVGFVNDVYQLFSYKARTKNILFSFVHHDAAIMAYVDRGNFDKVLINLLSNAFKYTPTGGTVEISMKSADGCLSIAVRDTGEGVPADKMDKIFERFYQGVTKTNELNFGTGIGLDLTRSLVELHHGTISVANNADGKGCTFTVTIPLGKEHIPAEQLASASDDDSAFGSSDIASLMAEVRPDDNTAAAKGARRHSATIAIVEDDEEIRTYLERELRDTYNIMTFSNGKDALKGILKDTPDLVVSDVMMPGMDGNTLCARLKSNINTNSMPVILLTAKAGDEDQIAGLSIGADAYITKPFNMEILRRTISNLITSRSMMKNKFEGKEEQEEKVDDIALESYNDKLLDKVMRVINDNIGDPDMSVEMIAKKVGVSRVHLYRKLKSLTNQSPQELVRNIRLKKAAKLLSTGQYNVTEVMYACGFSYANSFSQAFKNFYGCSPREYMHEHADDRQ